MSAACLAAFTCLAFFLLPYLATFIMNADYEGVTYKNVHYEVSVTQNGDLDVTQELEVCLPELSSGAAWHQLYWQYKVDPDQATSITDISVTDGEGRVYAQTDPEIYSPEFAYQWDSSHAYQWYVGVVESKGASQNISSSMSLRDYDAYQTITSVKTVEIGWNIPTTYSTNSMTFTVHMTFTGVATAYNDVAALQWEPIGEDNDVLINNLTARVTFPEGANEDTLKAWLHYEGTSTTARDGNMLTFSASNITSGQWVDLVAMFDVSLSNGIVRTNTADYYDTLMASETSQEQQWHFQQLIYVLVGLVSLLLAIVILVVVLRTRKALRYEGKYEYWRDIPTISPSSAARLIGQFENLGEGTIHQNATAGTLTSLVYRKFIALLPGKANWYRKQGLDAPSPSEAMQLLHDMNLTKDSKNGPGDATNTVVLQPIVYDRGGVSLGGARGNTARGAGMSADGVAGSGMGTTDPRPAAADAGRSMIGAGAVSGISGVGGARSISVGQTSDRQYDKKTIESLITSFGKQHPKLWGSEQATMQCFIRVAAHKRSPFFDFAEMGTCMVKSKKDMQAYMDISERSKNEYALLGATKPCGGLLSGVICVLLCALVCINVFASFATSNTYGMLIARLLMAVAFAALSAACYLRPTWQLTEQGKQLSLIHI